MDFNAVAFLISLAKKLLGSNMKSIFEGGNAFGMFVLPQVCTQCVVLIYIHFFTRKPLGAPVKSKLPQAATESERRAAHIYLV